MQITVTKKYLREIDRQQLEAQRAACRDSNDDEIDLLRDTLTMALSALDYPWRTLGERERERLMGF